MRLWMLLATVCALDVTQGQLQGYFTYEEVVRTLDGFHDRFPDLASPKFSIGKTVEQRDIWAIRLSSAPLLPSQGTLLVMAAHHAKELISVSFVLWAVDRLLTSNTTMSNYLLGTRSIM